jgi:hypothetical protein
MDFGWNKPAGQAQNDSTQTTANTDNTSTDSTPAPATPAAAPSSSWDLPQENNKSESQGGITSTEKDLDFSTGKSDDSFGNDFTVDSASSSEPAEAEIDEGKDDDGDKDMAASENTEIKIPSTEQTEEKDPTEDKAERAEAETEEEAEPADEPTKIINSAVNDKSLADLESDILAQKDKTDKDLADLQTKIGKLDELIEKVRKMQDEEKNLIQEISSAL